MQATTTHTESLEDCIETCNKMLRGERSAVETYDMAIDKFASDPVIEKLSAIRNDHAKSVADLEKNVIEMGGVPDRDSGAWGEFAQLVQAAANLIGEQSAVTSLKQGEEKGQSDYESAIEDGELTAACLDLYTNTLLPRIRRHIATLGTLSDAID